MYTENFDNFGFESSDPIRNLQVLFLFIMFLLTLPIIFLMIRAIFYWNARCQKGLKVLHRKMFWSTYIRFMLEAFLELCITSLLRIEHLLFDSTSEIFLSIFSLTILVILVVFMIGSFIFLYKNFWRLDNKEFKEKYGEFTREIKTK